MLQHKLAEYIDACFTGIWIQSHEHQDALAEIAVMCRDQGWGLHTWTIADGGDPVSTLNSQQMAEPANRDGTLLVLPNYHRFLQSPEVVQHLIRRLVAGKDNRTFVVILSPIVAIPVELEKLFVVVQHELPGRDELLAIAQGIATQSDELPQGRELEQLIDAAGGLTRLEAENAFSLSLVRSGRLQSDAVWELKTATLEKSGLLTLHRGDEDFSQLGGMASLKAFTKRALMQRPTDNVRPRGVLLLSPSGCGKSQFCKSLGKETGRPVLILDVGSLMGSLVGQSEERTRQALRIIDAMAPCVVMIDEVEKAFAGVTGSNDSGVSSRMFGTFLTWLNDHTSDVFVVCTANNVDKLPPEFSRAERFDGVFFLDLPGRAEKDAIWTLYREVFHVGDDQQPDDDHWTGAEIRSCCRLAALLDVPLTAAAQNVVPVAVTAGESVEKLRTWASGRCLSANETGIYQRRLVAPDSPRRNVKRNENN